MAQKIYDIAVVGLGPAGATFSRLAAGHFSLALIGRARDGARGFVKPCGGLLSSDAQKALAKYDLTLPKSLLVDPQIFAVRTIDVKSGLTRYYQRFYLNLDRDRFDKWLISLIDGRADRFEGVVKKIEKRAGLYFLTIRTGGREVEICARNVVGADGAGSIVRRAFFPARKMRTYVAIQQWFEKHGENPFYSCVFDEKTSDCCSWSIHKDRYFLYGGAFPVKNCRRAFETQKERLKSFGFQFGAPVKTEACLVRRPSRARDFVTGADSVFLIGEAAGFISPSSLEGFSWAFESAKRLYESFMEGGNVQRRYRAKTLVMRIKLLLKIIKCPFMYKPALRRIVMRAGIGSIEVERGEGNSR